MRYELDISRRACAIQLGRVASGARRGWRARDMSPTSTAPARQRYAPHYRGNGKSDPLISRELKIRLPVTYRLHSHLLSSISPILSTSVDLVPLSSFFVATQFGLVFTTVSLFSLPCACSHRCSFQYLKDVVTEPDSDFCV